MATTSGTVSTYPFNMRSVLDHAFRRAGRQPEKVTAEHLKIGQDLIFTTTSQYINAGFPLWTRGYLLLSARAAFPDVPCPSGTVEVLNAFWRQLSPWRGPATTTGAADASILFAGQPNADVIVAGPNPGVSVGFNGATEVDTIGVLLGGSTPLTTALLVQTSPDGATWTTAQTLPSTTFAPGLWSYFDLGPAVTAPFVQVVAPIAGDWTLNQLNFGLSGWTENQIGPLNIDDYYNLPNKNFQGSQVNSAWVDRQLNAPVIKIWPTLNVIGTYNGLVTALVRRYIQDPGQLTNNVEVPQRWLEMLIWDIARLLIYELPDDDVTNPFTLQAKQQRISNIQSEGDRATKLAWAEERSGGPIRWAPNISPYTA